MAKQKSPSPEYAKQQAQQPRESPLSLSRLREAFAAMLGEGGTGNDEAPRAYPARSETPEQPAPPSARLATPCEISPRSVAEAMLFVGRPDNGPLSARELAAAMRGVSPKEIEAAVGELNSLYQADGSPYFIEQSSGSYRMILRPEFERMRDKFYGKAKEAQLSPSALEVLSVLAYNQPATVEQLNELRGSPCGAALATLVRRHLVRIDRPGGAGGAAQYSTTERFLKLFGLESLGELPRSEELAQA